MIYLVHYSPWTVLTNLFRTSLEHENLDLVNHFTKDFVNTIFNIREHFKIHSDPHVVQLLMYPEQLNTIANNALNVTASVWSDQLPPVAASVSDSYELDNIFLYLLLMIACSTQFKKVMFHLQALAQSHQKLNFIFSIIVLNILYPLNVLRNTSL